MIKNSLRQLCLLSVFCGAALKLCPEGRVKKLMNVLAAAVLLISLISPFRGFDFPVYAAGAAALKEHEAELLNSGREMHERLDRLSIGKEYEAYVKKKAAEEGLNISEIKIKLSWNTDGFWVPEELEISSGAEPEKIRRFSGILSAELGIPGEKQRWNSYG